MMNAEANVGNSWYREYISRVLELFLRKGMSGYAYNLEQREIQGFKQVIRSLVNQVQHQLAEGRCCQVMPCI